MSAVTFPREPQYRQNMGEFSKLPNEIILKIFKYLDVNSALNFAFSCKGLYLQNNQELWKHYCIRDLFSDVSTKCIFPTDKNYKWKDCYRDFEQFLLIPFPGEPAFLEIVPPRFGQVFDDRKFFQFRSTNPDTLIQQVNFIEYDNGAISFSVELSQWNSKIEAYFKAAKFKKPIISKEVLTFSKPEDIRRIFKIVKHFNQLPDQYLGLNEKQILDKYLLENQPKNIFCLGKNYIKI